MSTGLDFLGSDAGGIKIPTGGGTLTGMIGQFLAKLVFRTNWTDLDLGENSGAKVIETSASMKHRYWFDDYRLAAAAQELINSDFQPEQAWRFETSKDSVLNLFSEEAQRAFSDTIAYSLTVRTMKSAKYRHEFHLFALPFAVQAIAMLLGYIEDPIMDVNDLIVAGDLSRFDDDYQKEWIGDPDDKTAEGMMVSKLGQQRAALWAALGETNKLAYVQRPGSFQATAPKLVECLNIVENPWIKPTYLELGTALDPRVDATRTGNDGAEHRLRIPVILRFFKSKAEAQAAADEQRKAWEEREGNVSASAAPATDGRPALPASWDIPGITYDEFTAAVLEKGNTAANPKAMVAAAKELDITLDEFKEWYKYLRSAA